jgi:hypothetical protein
MRTSNIELIDLILTMNSADINALQDAQFTLESIKQADPGTYDEIINQSLQLINKALGLSCHDAIDKIAEQLGVEV